MNPQMVLDLTMKAIVISAQLCAPLMITTIVVGVLVNIIQTVTSIRDQTLAFVPKVAAAAVVMGFTLPWGIQTMNTYFEEMFMMMGQMGIK